MNSTTHIINRTSFRCGRGVLVALLFAAVAHDGYAVTLVDWGGDYVSSTELSQRVPTGSLTTGPGTIWYISGTQTNSAVRGIAFSDTTALNPNANYSGTSSQFYGAVGGGRTDNNGFAGFATINAQIVDNGAADQIAFQLLSGTTSARAAAGTLFWKKEDFLNGGDMASHDLEDLTLSMNVASIGTGLEGGTAMFRIFVQAGSTYYYSAAISGLNSTGAKTITGATLAATNFYALSGTMLLTDNSFARNNLNGTAGAAILGSDGIFNDISAFGFSFSTGSHIASLDASIAIDSLEIVTSVPEPSATVLLMTAGLVTICGRRRRVAS